MSCDRRPFRPSHAGISPKENPTTLTVSPNQRLWVGRANTQRADARPARDRPKQWPPPTPPLGHRGPLPTPVTASAAFGRSSGPVPTRRPRPLSAERRREASSTFPLFPECAKLLQDCRPVAGGRFPTEPVPTTGLR